MNSILSLLLLLLLTSWTFCRFCRCCWTHRRKICSLTERTVPAWRRPNHQVVREWSTASPQVEARPPYFQEVSRGQSHRPAKKRCWLRILSSSSAGVMRSVGGDRLLPASRRACPAVVVVSGAAALGDAAATAGAAAAVVAVGFLPRRLLPPQPLFGHSGQH